MEYNVWPENGDGAVTSSSPITVSTMTVPTVAPWQWPDMTPHPWQPTLIPTITWWYSPPQKTTTELFEELLAAARRLEDALGHSSISKRALDVLREKVIAHEVAALRKRLGDV